MDSKVDNFYSRLPMPKVVGEWPHYQTGAEKTAIPIYASN